MKRWGAGIIVLMGWLGAPQALAANCSFSISTLDFGVVDTLSGQPHPGTATLSISCSNVVSGYVKICPHIGAGSGGATGGVRHMRNPSNAPLDYTLSTDVGGLTLWGAVNALLLGGPPTIELTTSLFGSVNATRTIYGTVQGGQQDAPAGIYQSQMTTSDVQISVSELFLFNCLTLQSPVSAPFTVRAEVEPYCEVSADPLDFGQSGVLAANIDVNGRVGVRCTQDTTWSLALDNGQTGTGPTARRMTLGGSFITYGLYLNAARTQPWGSSVGQVATGSGTGAVQNRNIYGRVPPQTTPGPGVYTDVVVATVTY